MRRSATDHVDLCVGVPHVADNAAVLHAVEVLSDHHVLIAWWRHCRKKLKGKTEKKPRVSRKYPTLKKGKLQRNVFFKLQIESA